MSIAFGPSLSQKDPALKPGDIDDCWVVAGIQCARAVGGAYDGPGHVSIDSINIPTIPEFRAKAGKPDAQGVSNGGSADDVLKGSLGCFPHLHVTKAPRDWASLLAALKAGKVAALGVTAGKLPAALQYGFKGGHEVSVRWAVSGLYVVNPLQPKGTNAHPIDAASLKAAVLAFGGGFVSGVLYAPATVIVVPAPAPAPAPVPAPAPAFTQADIDVATKVGYNAGYDKGVQDGNAGDQAAIDAAVAATKAAAHIVIQY